MSGAGDGHWFSGARRALPSWMPGALPPAPAKPPAKAGTSAKTGCQTCPLQAKKVCDVTKLTVKVVMQGDAPADRSLKPLTKRLRGSPLTDPVDKKIAELLRAYDHVVDTVAAYPGREDVGPKDVVSIEMQANYVGTCPQKKHGELVLKQTANPSNWIFDKATGSYKQMPFQDIRKVGAKLGPVTVFAPSLNQDFGAAGGNLSILFDIIRTIWPSHNPRHIELRSDTCGVRNDKSAPNDYLTTLVRIYRKDSYQIGVKIPPLGKFAHERAGSVTGLPKSSSSTSASAAGGLYRRDDKSERSGQDWNHSTERWRGNKGEGYSQSSSQSPAGLITTRESSAWTSSGGGLRYSQSTGNLTGTTYRTNSELFGALEKSSGFQLVIKRNDREFSWAKDPNDKRSLKEKILDGLSNAVKGIQTAIDTLKKLPQLGWKFTFSVSLFEGSLAGNWEPKPQAPTSSGRYHPVKHAGSIKIGMDIFALSLDLSFGVDARALGTGVVAKVGIEGGVKVGVEKEFTFSIPPTDSWTSVDLKPVVTFTGYAVGYASLLGYSVIDARLECRLMFSLVEGKLKIDPKKGLTVTGTLRRDPIMLKGYVKSPAGFKPMTPIKLCDGADIAKFG